MTPTHATAQVWESNLCPDCGRGDQHSWDCPAERNATIERCAQVAKDFIENLTDSKSKTMSHWDEIRAQCLSYKGSDLPRLNFESLIETIAEDTEAAIRALKDREESENDINIATATAAAAMTKAEKDFYLDTPYSEPNDGWGGEPLSARLRGINIDFASRQNLYSLLREAANEIDRLTAAAQVDEQDTFQPVLVNDNEAMRTLHRATIERCAQWLEERYEFAGAMANAMRRALKDKP